MRGYRDGWPSGLQFQWSDKGRYKYRCCIQGTWFLVNKRPRVITTDGHGVRRGVIFKEIMWVFFRKGKDGTSEIKRNSLIYKFCRGIKGGWKGLSGKGIRTRVEVEKLSL